MNTLWLLLTYSLVFVCALDEDSNSTEVKMAGTSGENFTDVYHTTVFTTIETDVVSNIDYKIPIYLGGFLSIDGGVWDGSGLLPAIELALEHVNARPDVLNRYELRMVWNDSQCMAGLGTRFLFEQLFRKPQKVMLIGPACSPDSQAVSQTAYYWNLITLSYSAASSALSNRDEYPYFFRTYVPDAMYNPLRIKLMQKYNWTRVATIHTNFEVFSLAIDNLRTLLKQANITILASESFGESPKNQMENIKATDAHIIIGNMYEREARKVFCEAYHQGMYGKNYMWLLLGWWSKDWWLVDDTNMGDNLTCTPEELIETVASSMYIATEVEELDKSSQETVAGYTASEIEEMYKRRLQLPEYADARASGVDFFGYDAAWSIALTLNKSSAIMDAGGLSGGSTRNLEDFDYDDKEMAELFFNVFQNIQFQGATGHVSFSDADRVGPTKLEQIQGYCADGWHLHGIYCYRFIHNETTSWTRARSTCGRFTEPAYLSTGVLTAILSQEEFNFLSTIWQTSNTISSMPQWHIGLHMETGSESLRWVDISKDQPSWLPDSAIFETALEGPKCFAFDFRNGGSWVTVDCNSDVRPFICRKLAYFEERYITSVIPSDTTGINVEKLRWPGGVIPIDHTPGNTYLDVDVGIPLLLYVIVGGIAMAGILMTLFFLIFNIYFAKQRFVKLSSPKLNNLILVGSLFIYLSIVMAGFQLQNNKRSFPSVCAARTWMISIGFVLAFGAMFSKTWRVHRVATFKTPKRRIVTDQQLFGIVGFLLLVDVAVLTSWQVLDPQRLETVKLAEMPDPEVEMQVLRPYIELCTSDQVLIWSSALYGYKGLLLIFGTFLAWETRKVTIPALNDSKLIGLSVYNVIILCAIGLGVSFALGDDPGSLFLFISCITLFCTSVTLIVIFVPKIISVYKDPKGENAISTNTISNSENQRTTFTSETSVAAVRSISEENRSLREKITELQKTLASTSVSTSSVAMTPSNEDPPVTVEVNNQTVAHSAPSESSTNTGCGIWIGGLSVGCELGSHSRRSGAKYRVDKVNEPETPPSDNTKESG